MNAEPGQMTKIVEVELTQIERLAVTSTLTMIDTYDQVTAELQEQLNVLRQRVAKRTANRDLMNKELTDVWAGVVVHHELPSTLLDPRTVEWLPGGVIRVPVKEE